MNSRLANKACLMICIFMLTTLISCTERQKNISYKPLSQDELKSISQPTNEIVISSQATVRPEFMLAGHAIEAKGYIDYDRRRDKIVSARFTGRIEKLYVKYENQYIHQGDKILEVYSPELNTFQEQYLYLSHTNADTEMFAKARKKLLLIGLTPEQLNQITRNNHILQSVPVYSPYSGFIRFDGSGNTAGMPSAQNNNSGMEGMNGQPKSNEDEPVETNGVRIREGSYITKGQSFFTVNDLESVWGIIAIESSKGALVKAGNPIKIKSELLDSEMETNVAFVEQVFRNGQKFIMLRTYLPNKNKILKISSLLTASLFPDGKKHLMLPVSAIYDMGNKKIAWLATGRRHGKGKEFKAVPLITGTEMNDRVEISAGLFPGSEVAKDAGFMVDRESFTKIQ